MQTWKSNLKCLSRCQDNTMTDFVAVSKEEELTITKNELLRCKMINIDKAINPHSSSINKWVNPLNSQLRFRQERKQHSELHIRKSLKLKLKISPLDLDPLGISHLRQSSLLRINLLVKWNLLRILVLDMDKTIRVRNKTTSRSSLKVSCHKWSQGHH